MLNVICKSIFQSLNAEVVSRIVDLNIDLKCWDDVQNYSGSRVNLYSNFYLRLGWSYIVQGNKHQLWRVVAMIQGPLGFPAETWNR